MSRRLMINLLLLALVLVLALIAYCEPGRGRIEVSRLLPEVQPQEIMHITIVKPQGESISLLRQPPGWRIISPIRVAANVARVDALLRITMAVSHDHFAAMQQPLGNFQLHEPLGSLVLNEHKIDFGMVHPLTRQRYVRSGGQVHLINDIYFYRSQLTLAALVDPHLIPPQQQLVGLVLPGAELVYDSEVGWQLASEAATPNPVENAALLRWVNEWRQAEAEQVVSYLPGTDETGASRLIMHFADGGQLVYLIQQDQNDVHLARADIGMRYKLAGLGKLLTVPGAAQPVQTAK